MLSAADQGVAGVRAEYEQSNAKSVKASSLLEGDCLGVEGDGAQVNLEEIGVIGHTLKPQTIYAIGDSHAMFFSKQVIFEKHTTQSFFVKSRYMASPACVPSTIYNSGGIDPRIISFLRNEGLFFNGEVKHYSRSPSMIAEASMLGAPVVPPIIVLSCGDIAIRSELLPKLTDGSIFYVPGSPYNDGLPKGRALPYEAVVAQVDAMARPILHAALELRRIGFPRIFVHSVVPPTCDRALFDRMHGFVVHKNVHYNLVYLLNKILKEICAAHVIDFVDNWDSITDENGFRRPEFELDGVHVGTKAATYSLQKVLRRTLNNYYDLNFPRYRLLYDIAAANFQKPLRAGVAVGAAIEPGTPEVMPVAPTPAPPVNHQQLRRIARAIRHPRRTYATLRQKGKRMLLDRLGAEVIGSSRQTIITLPTEELFKPKDAPNIPTPGMCNYNARPDLKVNDPMFARAAEKFFREGCTSIVLDQKLVQLWRNQLNFNLPVTNPAANFEWAGNGIGGYSDKIRRSNVPTSMLSGMCDRFDQKDFEELFGALLGCRTMLLHIRAFHTEVTAGAGEGPQAWHNDGCPDGLLRGILYLTDVDERSGAFQYKNQKGEIVSMIGPRGTLVIFDADRVLHRGCPPKDRYREALDLTFSPRMNSESMMAFSNGTNIFPYDPFFFSINSTIGDPLSSKTINRYQAALNNIGDLG